MPSEEQPERTPRILKSLTIANKAPLVLLFLILLQAGLSLFVEISLRARIIAPLVGTATYVLVELHQSSGSVGTIEVEEDE